MLKTSFLLAAVLFTNIAGANPAHLEQDVPQKHNIWYTKAQNTLAQRLKTNPITGKAKNIILMIADGNSIDTNTAGRIYTGQRAHQSGEGYVLAYEKFPFTGLIKTYNTNAQTPDSAGTASAIMTGIKTKQGVLGVDETLMRQACNTTNQHIARTLAEQLKAQGKSIGIVSTSLLTDATPASVYAHSADRAYQASVPVGCTAQKDIATQMVSWSYGDGLDVMLGGGRRNFLPNNQKDAQGIKGKRDDGQNLIQSWLHTGNRQYVWNKQTLSAFDTGSGQQLMGLFNTAQMAYDLDRQEQANNEPSLAEMTKVAIQTLSHNKEGFFLMVEAGRVDHANHAGNAARALADVRAFNQAVTIADKLTDDNDTLIIVTADHGHTLSLSGYAPIGNDILGLVKTINADGSISDTPQKADDGKPYTVIGYMNGPGSVFNQKGDHNGRSDLTEVDVTDKNFQQQALIPKHSETHSGADVAVYAKGPWAHLLSGVSEQNVLYHVMQYASQPAKITQ